MSYRNIALLLLVAACSKKAGSGAGTSSDSAPAESTAARAPMELKAVPMLPVVRAHLDSLAQKPGMMHARMGQHQAEVKHLVEAMHSDMMALGVHSDAAYESLADSVVRGSARLGTAGGTEFNRLVLEHVDQVRRLAAIYETKTAGMR
jgi:hypothetical protein